MVKFISFLSLGHKCKGSAKRQAECLGGNAVIAQKQTSGDYTVAETRYCRHIYFGHNPVYTNRSLFLCHYKAETTIFKGSYRSSICSYGLYHRKISRRDHNYRTYFRLEAD